MNCPALPQRLFPRFVLSLSIACCGAAAMPCAAQSPPAVAAQAGTQPQPQSPGVSDYIDGIDALKNADYPGAVEALNRAVAADDENVEYLRARGVANALAERFPAALKDLQRCDRLKAGDAETLLWLAASYRMSGDFQKGSSLFAFRPGLPNDYTDMVYNEMAMEYGMSKERGYYYDRAQKQQVKVEHPVTRHFADAARTYAQRHEASGAGAAVAVAARMKDRFGRGQWASALRDIALLQQARPDDAGLRGYQALCLLNLGDAWHARQELTRALNVEPAWGDGYVARAKATAMLGDARRAKTDLQTAEKLKSPALQQLRQQIDELLSKSQPPPDAVDRFNKTVASGADFPSLVDAALAVQRYMNGTRSRYDEQYQDRIRAMAVAMQDDPKSADRCEALARFLLDHRSVPIVWNGLRSDGHQLRPQDQNEKLYEVNHAIELCDQALKLDPHHANSMATKGWACYILNRSSEAAELADSGLQAAPQNVRLLQLKAQLLSDEAGALAAQASALLMGHDETRRETRADGIYEVHTHYPPSAQQQASAQALQAQASALHDQARQLLNQMDRVESEVIPPLLKQGDAALSGNDAAGARRAFEQVYNLDPDHADLQKRLAQTYAKLSDSDWSQVFALLAEPLRETTAADDLKAAWDDVTRTAWTSATRQLDQAAAADPADPRVLAYRSVIAAGREPADPTAAQHDRLGALALDEARAQLMGTSYLHPNPQGDVELLDPESVGLTMSLRVAAGQQYLTAGEPNKALDTFAANLSLENRFDKQRLTDLVPTAMLPDPTATELPTAPSLATLLADSRLGEARALLALGRNDDAKQQFLAVRAYLANWPLTHEGRETLYVDDAWAMLGLAQAAYASKDYETAFNLLETNGGWPGKLPDDLIAQKTALTKKVDAARIGPDESAGESPLMQSLRATRLWIKQQQDTRDQLAKQLNSESDPRRRQAMQNQIRQMDIMIDRQKAELQQMQSAAQNSQ